MQRQAKLHDLIPGFKGIAKFLTPAEREGMITRTAKLLVEKFTNLPSAKEMAAVAYSGRAKKGWYNSSAKALVSVFGQEDAPRFAALLAALSPQTTVESNLHNAANVWRGWIEADRPKDERSIMRILGENVEGDRGPDSVLPAWVNNSVRALTAETASHHDQWPESHLASCRTCWARSTRSPTTLGWPTGLGSSRSVLQGC
jgi:hypothetical protein